MLFCVPCCRCVVACVKVTCAVAVVFVYGCVYVVAVVFIVVWRCDVLCCCCYVCHVLVRWLVWCGVFVVGIRGGGCACLV